MKKILVQLFTAVLLFSTNCIAQADKKYDAIDEYVKKLGKLDTLTMGTISSIVTRPYTDKEEKVRAIYSWIAHNIEYDVKMARSGNISKNSPTEVLQYRKAVGIGFASLFQDMCSSADIRCLTADGYLKYSAEQIGESDVEINHSWAVVQLGKSPEQWYYVDVALASGNTDAAMKTFTPAFSPAYFFPDRKTFNWQHFPDNEAWKLGEAPKTKKDFYALPVIKTGAYEFELTKFSPAMGKIKTKSVAEVTFSLSFSNTSDINKVELVYGEAKKQQTKEVTFKSSSGSVSFSNMFKEGEYPVMIKINGKEVIGYWLTAEE